MRPLRPAKYIPQFVFGSFQNTLLFLGKGFARAIYIEVEHRHRRLIRRALAPLAGVCRAFERERDPAWISWFKNLWFEIQRVALFCNPVRPTLVLRTSAPFWWFLPSWPHVERYASWKFNPWTIIPESMALPGWALTILLSWRRLRGILVNHLWDDSLWRRVAAWNNKSQTIAAQDYLIQK